MPGGYSGKISLGDDGVILFFDPMNVLIKVVGHAVVDVLSDVLDADVDALRHEFPSASV